MLCRRWKNSHHARWDPRLAWVYGYPQPSTARRTRQTEAAARPHTATRSNAYPHRYPHINMDGGLLVWYTLGMGWRHAPTPNQDEEEHNHGQENSKQEARRSQTRGRGRRSSTRNGLDLKQVSGQIRRCRKQQRTQKQEVRR